MIHTLFIFNPVGEIIMEKHWRGTLPRSVGEDFWANVVMKGVWVGARLPPGLRFEGSYRGIRVLKILIL